MLTNRNNPVYMEPVTSNDSIEVKICCTKGNFSSLGLFMQDWNFRPVFQKRQELLLQGLLLKILDFEASSQQAICHLFSLTTDHSFKIIIALIQRRTMLSVFKILQKTNFEVLQYSTSWHPEISQKLEQDAIHCHPS